MEIGMPVSISATNKVKMSATRVPAASGSRPNLAARQIAISTIGMPMKK